MRISNYYVGRFFVAIAVVCLTAGLSLVAQERSRDAAPLSFVFLPLRSTQQLEMSGEQFMDEVIKVIRMRGHNAVSTRYLRSVLMDSRFGELEACTTSVCMNKLVNQVGTRFVIHGSLYSDSSSDYIIELHIVDAPRNALISVQMESFDKNPESSGAKILDFTDRILSDVKKAVSNGIVQTPEIQQPAVDTVASVVQPDEVAPQQSAETDTQEVVKATDAVQADAVNALPDTWAEELPKEKQGSVPETGAGSTYVQATTENSESAPVLTETPQLSQQEPGIIASVADVDTVEPAKPDPAVSANIETSIDKSVVRSVPQEESSRPVLLADGPSVPADALKRSNKSKILKRVRISGFGVVALSGFIGGIMTNNTVKKSLDDEKALFNRYMNANANQTRVTYQEYIDQTEKTDAKMRQRTFLYVLSGLGLAACGISFKF